MFRRWASQFKDKVGRSQNQKEPYATIRREDHDLAEPEHSSSYSPLWTRRIVILFFLICFIALLASLEIVKRVSESENGLAQIADQRNWYYAWTYGPTASMQPHVVPLFAHSHS